MSPVGCPACSRTESRPSSLASGPISFPAHCERLRRPVVILNVSKGYVSVNQAKARNVDIDRIGQVPIVDNDVSAAALKAVWTNEHLDAAWRTEGVGEIFIRGKRRAKFGVALDNPANL